MSIMHGEQITRERACWRLTRAGYGTEAPALLELADRFPGTWHYTADRHRTVVRHMPAGTYEVADCEESEERIKALKRARGRRP